MFDKKDYLVKKEEQKKYEKILKQLRKFDLEMVQCQFCKGCCNDLYMYAYKKGWICNNCLKHNKEIKNIIKSK